MSKLLNRSLKNTIAYSAIVLACSIPVYYFILSELWRYEMAEHNITLSPEAGREDSFLIIGTVTMLTVLFFGLLIAGLILVNRRSSGKLWRPFYSSLEKIRNFDLTQQTPAFEPTNIAEFEELNEQLHKLIDRATVAYKQQKEFTENASHELQTPLAILTNKVDILLQSDGLTEKQFHIAEEMYKALIRSSRINKNLLLLAKIENGQFDKSESISIRTLLGQSMEVLQEYFAEKKISVDLNIHTDVEIQANCDLTEVLLNNLLMNAIRHTPAGGVIRVILSVLKLEVKNSGEHALNPDLLFKRFSKMSADNAGSGLGLSIVQEICKLHGWEVKYRFENKEHIFTVLF
ncbi:MAG TPA: HAMP domain-containing sensor histidine kinase [Niabella sp.]|nr:HAMP domain-containing sensor histidine kinase [Niabella sp.]HQX72524.1 HAMP domain-containing sensor histidine kinase [Chitinophagaceae bacterium]HQW16287.1 HAMP domain-containing sensor histidine kinase [Niabella sp.]HQX21481.1 HAMP domain-containing sensor histidine kinase [Niabella sp.]HRB36105.1 HAMP domain-containing sensor histidine kinase [Niabella sp.]